MHPAKSQCGKGKIAEHQIRLLQCVVSEKKDEIMRGNACDTNVNILVEKGSM